MTHRTWTLAIGGLIVLLGLAGSVGFSSEARASHYRLAGSDIVSPAELKALSTAGVATTLELLERAAPRKARRKLARETGLTPSRLAELGAFCDLLRVKGIGPTMVRLLQAAKVMHTGHLKRSVAASLRERMEEANAARKVSETVPDEATVADWIGQARSLPKLLEGAK